MHLRFLAAAAALTVPAIASAQVAPGARTANVEIVATGAIDVPASWFTVSLTYSVSAEDEAAAQKAHADKQAAIRAAAQKAGVPASAVTIEPDTATTTKDESSIETLTPIEIPSEDAEADKGKKHKDEEATVDAEPPQEPALTVTIKDRATVKVTSLDQAKALTEALSAIDVSAEKPLGVLGDPDGARRQAKVKALSVARGDAEAYGRELGLRPVRVSRISEGSNQLVLPGLQQKFLQAVYSGPQALQALQALFLNPNPATVHIEETVVVEFVMAP